MIDLKRFEISEANNGIIIEIFNHKKPTGPVDLEYEIDELKVNIKKSLENNKNLSFEEMQDLLNKIDTLLNKEEPYSLTYVFSNVADALEFIKDKLQK